MSPQPDPIRPRLIRYLAFCSDKLLRWRLHRTCSANKNGVVEFNQCCRCILCEQVPPFQSPLTPQRLLLVVVGLATLAADGCGIYNFFHDVGSRSRVVGNWHVLGYKWRGDTYLHPAHAAEEPGGSRLPWWMIVMTRYDMALFERLAFLWRKNVQMTPK